MAEQVPLEIQAADRRAEELAKSQREPFNRDIDPAREADLDAAFEAATAGKPAKSDEPDPSLLGRENGGVPQPLDGAPKAEELAAAKATADKAAADAAAEVAAAKAAATSAAKPVDPNAPPKGLLEDLTATEAPKPATVADPYAVTLRSDASPKTKETFEQLKLAAKQREDAALAQAADVQKKLDEANVKVGELEKRTVAPEVDAELKELRQFRAQFDTANDPVFRQKFQSLIDANYTAIYAKLAEHGLPAAELDKVKTFSPAARDQQIDEWAQKLPSLDRKQIEAKLLANINVTDERDKALQEARTNADKLLAERGSLPAKQTAQRDQAVAALLKPVLGKLPWILVQDVPANAAPEEKKRLEADNKFAVSMQAALRTAIIDDSPAIRAEAAIAVPMAHYYRAQHAAEKARADKLQEKLTAIEGASATSRISRAANISTSAAPQQKDNQPAGEAIDDLFAAATGRTA